jgi:pimeloyl-ACP methyl ester carboxylesterase
MNIYEWGDPSNTNMVICVHGLTRNGRDFDFIAKELAKTYRVICPDIVGRGKSDYLKNPADYNYMTYIADILHLMQVREITSCDWVGTSMGGLIGMMVAANIPGTIKKLVINDIGPFISKEGLNRIGDYVGKAPELSSHQEAITYLKDVFAPWGIKDESIIEHMVETSLIDENGNYSVAYDAHIADVFRDEDGNANIKDDIDLWEVWDGVQCPTLVLRGENSDVLSADVALRMNKKPNNTLHEFKNIGHAPSLMEVDQIKLVVDWLKN